MSSLRIVGAGLAVVAIVMGGYPVVALTAVVLLSALAVMMLKRHQRRGVPMPATAPFVSAGRGNKTQGK
jgi:hypothetical protein